MRLNKDEYKRKLKIFGLIFITLLLPFVISFANFTIIFLLQDTFGITNDSMSFIIHLIGLIRSEEHTSELQSPQTIS